MDSIILLLDSLRIGQNNISGNLTELLPFIIKNLPLLKQFDVSFANLYGSITEEAIALDVLQTEGNNQMLGLSQLIPAKPHVEAEFQLYLPSFYYVDYSSSPSTLIQQSLSCPPIRHNNTNSLVSLSPSYLFYQHCNFLSNTVRCEPDRNKCIQCPSNLLCDTSMLQPIHRVKKGFYPYPLSIDEYNTNSLTLLTATLLTCYDTSICNPDETQDFECSQGFDSSSLLCSKCSINYYQWQQECIKCIDNANWIIPLFGSIGIILCILLLLLYILYRELKSSSSNNVNNSNSNILELNIVPDINTLYHSNNRIQTNNMDNNDNKSHSTAIFSIILFWLQSQSVLSSSSSNQTSSTSISIIGSILNFTPIGLECVNNELFDYEFFSWIRIFLPILLPLFIVLPIYFVGNISHINILLFLYKPIHSCISSRVLPSSISNEQWCGICIRLLFILWNICYMRVIQTIFESWNCVDIESYNSSYLSSQPYITCYTSSHIGLIVFGVFILILFILGLPILQFYSSYSHRHQSSLSIVSSLSNTSSSLKSIFFTILNSSSTDNFNKSLYYWSIILTMRKIFLTGFISLLSRQSSSLPLLVLFLLNFLISIHTWFRPYKLSIDNISETILLGHLSLLYLVQIIRQMTYLSLDSKFQVWSLSTVDNFYITLQIFGICIIFLIFIFHIYQWKKIKKHNSNSNIHSIVHNEKIHNSNLLEPLVGNQYN